MTALSAILLLLFASTEALPLLDDGEILPKEASEGEGVGDLQQGTLPDSVTLKTLVRFDKSLLDDFSGDKSATEKALRMVVHKTQEALNLLPVKVSLEVTGYEYYPETILPDRESLYRLMKIHFNEGRTGHVSYFCSKGTKDAAGIAFLDNACDTSGAALNINSQPGSNSMVRGDLQGVADLFSHELGHNLGMQDLEEGGLMAGQWTMNNGQWTVGDRSWADTSKQQFETWMKSSDSTCLTEN